MYTDVLSSINPRLLGFFLFRATFERYSRTLFPTKFSYFTLNGRVYLFFYVFVRWHLTPFFIYNLDQEVTFNSCWFGCPCEVIFNSCWFGCPWEVIFNSCWFGCPWEVIFNSCWCGCPWEVIFNSCWFGSPCEVRFNSCWFGSSCEVRFTSCLFGCSW